MVSWLTSSRTKIERLIMNDNVNLFRTPHVDCYSSTLTLYFSTVSVSASVVHQWLHKKCIFDVLRGFLKDIRNGYVELYRTLEYRIKKESPVIIYRVYRVYRVYRLYRLYRLYRCTGCTGCTLYNIMSRALFLSHAWTVISKYVHCRHTTHQYSILHNLSMSFSR